MSILTHSWKELKPGVRLQVLRVCRWHCSCISFISTENLKRYEMRPEKKTKEKKRKSRH